MLRLLEIDSRCYVVLVEKTDRLYRNPTDTWRFGQLVETRDVVLHLVKEGIVLDKNSKSKDKFMHDIQVALAKHYIDNLREEVKKGMHEKAKQGMYPSLG
jgi:site-specific DNA recombinase